MTFAHLSGNKWIPFCKKLSSFDPKTHKDQIQRKIKLLLEMRVTIRFMKKKKNVKKSVLDQEIESYQKVNSTSTGTIIQRIIQFCQNMQEIFWAYQQQVARVKEYFLTLEIKFGRQEISFHLKFWKKSLIYEGL